MAEAVLFDIAKSLLGQLSSPLKDEFLLLGSSKAELEKLSNTFTTVKDVLQDAEKKQATDATVKRWLGRLRDEIYKADDLFDKISTRALQKQALSGGKIAKEVRLFFSQTSNHLALLVSTAHKVKQLRGNLDDICNDINRFNFVRSETEAPIPIDRPEEGSYVKEDGIIGRDEDKKSIVNILKADAGDGGCVSVIAIVGIGGLGKTALAQLVYNELEKGQDFDLYLWACVNYFSNLNEALQKIVACGTENTYKDLTLQQLQFMLREKINRRKYLLVLDDVWDDDLNNWLKLKDLLDVGDIGSKVLMTTRSIEVARNLSTANPPYSLKGLSDDSAWLLFKKFAFDPNESEKIQKMEKIGKDIVRKCANVPLAIRTIGSFLRHKDERRWVNVLTKEISEGHDKTMEVLKVSYNDLPSSLKHCFAYCSLFPKDYQFDKDELIHLWMAQGYLESSDNREQSLEDVGEDYFYSLVGRSLFQELETHSNSGKVSCRMHDLLHDLAVMVAGKECNMVKFSPGEFKEPSRHLSYNCEADFSRNIPNSLLQMEGLRTLLFHEARVVNGAFLDYQFLHLLRVLDLSYVDMEELPSSIGMLIHLRYLDLSMNKVLIKLPASIRKLQNLLSLKLRGCWRLKELPDDLKLIRLRHLDIEGCSKLTSMPSGLKQMTCLVTLNMFVVNNKDGGLRHLKDLNNLRGKLQINLPSGGWENWEADAKESMLSSKTELSGLVFKWRDPEVTQEMSSSDAVLDQLQPSRNLQYLTIDGFKGTRISRWVGSLENIIRLVIHGCSSCREFPPFQHELVTNRCSRCCKFPPFWHLRCLKQLYIADLPHVEYMENDICNDEKSFFPSLVELRISHMPYLHGWWKLWGQATLVSQNSSLPWFPRLSLVSIWDCPRLTDLPLFPYVETLELREVNEELLTQSTLKADERVGHFSALRSLTIAQCPELKSLPHHLLECLTSLEELDILGCEVLKLFDENEEEDETQWSALKRLKRLAFTIRGSNILKGLHHLTALKKLSVSVTPYCSDAKEVLMQWKTPPILQHLKILYATEASPFLVVFFRLNKLVVLEFETCAFNFARIPWEALEGLRCLIFRWQLRMRVLPEGCRYLPALQELVLEYCDELEVLPDWTTRLQLLSILNCPRLMERYNRQSGPYWSQIRGIPYVKIEQH